jgi:hypothetical protein
MSHLTCLKIVLNKPAFSNQKIVLKVLVFKIRSKDMGTSLVAQTVKHLSTIWETWVLLLAFIHEFGISLKKETATHSSIHAWKIPWTKEPSGLQSMGSQRVGHD